MSRRIRQVLSTSATAALLVTLANCADSPTSSLTPSSGPSLSQGTSANAQAGDDVVPGEILVGLKSDTDAPGLARENGLGVGRAGYANAYRVLTVTAGNERAMAARLAADPRVEYAEPNYIRHVDADKNSDGIDDALWAFFNPGGLNMTFSDPTDSRYGTALPSTYASILDKDEDNIAGFAAGGAAVTIGSIDTGVDFSHPELSGRLIPGKDWVDNDNDPSDTKDEGHGTHTTGTMAGSKVGVAGIAGAASNVKVYVQRVCGPNGCPTSAIINAINAAADYLDGNGKHLVAINLSLGGGTESSGEKTAIQKATNAGVLVIASAGNDGRSRISCPACDANAISVAATNWRDEQAYYTNYGNGLDISAPGGACYSNTTPEGCILSSVVSGYTGGSVVAGPIAGASYTYMQGTSMAAPQVTGVAAIVASKTGLTGSGLRSRILSTADQIGSATKFGAGRVNAYRAVTGIPLGAGQ